MWRSHGEDGCVDWWQLMIDDWWSSSTHQKNCWVVISQVFNFLNFHHYFIRRKTKKAGKIIAMPVLNQSLSFNGHRSQVTIWPKAFTYCTYSISSWFLPGPPSFRGYSASSYVRLCCPSVRWQCNTQVKRGTRTPSAAPYSTELSQEFFFLKKKIVYMGSRDQQTNQP
jgi:hypothetical protein